MLSIDDIISIIDHVISRSSTCEINSDKVLAILCMLLYILTIPKSSFFLLTHVRIIPYYNYAANLYEHLLTTALFINEMSGEI